MHHSWIVIACLGATTWLADDARAAEVKVEVAAKAGTSSIRDPIGVGFGLGGRVGASLSNFYAGLAFTYYFGGTGPSITFNPTLLVVPPLPQDRGPYTR
jgi:hypothetical protein